MATTKTVETHWDTAITKIQPNHVAVRGYDIAELMGRISFGAMIHLILRGELPSEPVGRLMDAIVVGSVDHGATPPSALATRTVASSGASLGQSVAAGILAINKHHGGAIENCARQLGKMIELADAGGGSYDDIAAEGLASMKERGERMSGFGHRFHTNDPRTRRLLELADEAGASGKHVAMARAVERAFEAGGKKLPINVDGAMGAVLADLGFEPRVMNGLFMIARTVGLVAQADEERQRMTPMRKIDPRDHGYDGPEDRSLGG